MAPIPSRKDGYQLVQASYWGMEHQSCIAYGNRFRPDEFGFDFILIHESGHEWWGNQLSVGDNADLWIHEAFCTYGEALLVERVQGRDSLRKYLAIQRSKIQNKSVLLGPRGVNYHGWFDSDIYYRGSLLLHTVRQMTGDSARFIRCLQGIVARHGFRPATTESVLQVLSDSLGGEKAAFMRHALSLAHPPIVRIAQDAGRLEGYTGPPIRLPGGKLLDGALRPLAKHDIPSDWLIEVRQQ